MDIAAEFEKLDWRLHLAAEQASTAEWAYDKGRADEDEQRQLDAEAASSERELVETTRRLRAEAPEGLAEWVARHITSLEKLLKQELTESQQEHVGELVREWREVASGAREVVTVRSCYYHKSYSDGRPGITVLSLL